MVVPLLNAGANNVNNNEVTSCGCEGCAEINRSPQKLVTVVQTARAHVSRVVTFFVPVDMTDAEIRLMSWDVGNSVSWEIDDENSHFAKIAKEPE